MGVCSFMGTQSGCVGPRGLDPVGDAVCSMEECSDVIHVASMLVFVSLFLFSAQLGCRVEVVVCCSLTRPVSLVLSHSLALYPSLSLARSLSHSQ